MCGGPNEADSKFCQFCGSDIKATSITENSKQTSSKIQKNEEKKEVNFEKSSEATRTETKKCPLCSNIIRQDSKICEMCGYKFDFSASDKISAHPTEVMGDQVEKDQNIGNKTSQPDSNISTTSKDVFSQNFQTGNSSLNVDGTSVFDNFSRSVTSSRRPVDPQIGAPVEMEKISPSIKQKLDYLKYTDFATAVLIFFGITIFDSGIGIIGIIQLLLIGFLIYNAIKLNTPNSKMIKYHQILYGLVLGFFSLILLDKLGLLKLELLNLYPSIAFEENVLVIVAGGIGAYFSFIDVDIKSFIASNLNGSPYGSPPYNQSRAAYQVNSAYNQGSAPYQDSHDDDMLKLKKIVNSVSLVNVIYFLPMLVDSFLAFLSTIVRYGISIEFIIIFGIFGMIPAGIIMSSIHIKKYRNWAKNFLIFIHGIQVFSLLNVIIHLLSNGLLIFFGGAYWFDFPESKYWGLDRLYRLYWYESILFREGALITLASLGASIYILFNLIQNRKLIEKCKNNNEGSIWRFTTYITIFIVVVFSLPGIIQI